ncbi:MAG: hypothetical protein H7Y42_07760 [Chitinophagaceae bacterium]|nr:hypothetical protein [Chitinophagaceae bacterium]
MDLPIEFLFRNKRSSCIVFIDSSASPCYVFAELIDADLIAEFGKEITVKTDFNQRLPKQDDYPALIEIRQIIFTAVKRLPDFVAAHHKIELLERRTPVFLSHHDS